MEQAVRGETTPHHQRDNFQHSWPFQPLPLSLVLMVSHIVKKDGSAPTELESQINQFLGELASTDLKTEVNHLKFHSAKVRISPCD
jgi:hypothetical protein